MFNFISLINILFMCNYLFINDEFAICVSLLIVFSFLLLSLKKYIIHLFFFIFDNIYFYFYILLKTNIHIYEYLLLKYKYTLLIINYNQIDLFLLISNIVYKKKIKEIILQKQIKKINILYIFTNITIFILKTLNNVTLKENILKYFKKFINLYFYIFLYNYTNRTKNTINFIC